MQARKKDIIIHTSITKMTIKIRMILNKQSHFTTTKKKIRKLKFRNTGYTTVILRETIKMIKTTRNKCLYCGTPLVKSVIFVVFLHIWFWWFYFCQMIRTYIVFHLLFFFVKRVCGASLAFYMFYTWCVWWFFDILFCILI